MSAWLIAPVVAAVASLAVAAWLVRRRVERREARRVHALQAVARRLETTLSSLEAPDLDEPWPEPPAPPRNDAPVIEGTVPGRAALLETLRESVGRARADGSRLAAAVVELDRDAVPSVCDEIGSVAGVPVYAVGPRSLGLVLPGLGRAGALGVLARIQAERGPKGRAVELDPEEDAIEMVARLLGAAE